MSDVSKIAAGLFQAFSQIGYVEKDKRNEFHRYSYASEEAILKGVREKLLEAGIMFIPSIREVQPIDQYGNSTVFVEYTILHKEGEVWPEKILAVGVGNDKSMKTGVVGDKGIYKALTGANKYLLLKLFQIATGNDPEIDTEKEAPELRQPAPQDQEPLQAPGSRNNLPPPPPPPRNTSPRSGAYKQVTPKSNGIFTSGGVIPTGSRTTPEDGRRLPNQSERDTCDMLILNLPGLETLRDIEAWKDRARSIFDRLPNICKRDIVRAVEKRQAEIDPTLGVVAHGQDGNPGDVYKD